MIQYHLFQISLKKNMGGGNHNTTAILLFSCSKKEKLVIYLCWMFDNKLPCIVRYLNVYFLSYLDGSYFLLPLFPFARAAFKSFETIKSIKMYNVSKIGPGYGDEKHQQGICSHGPEKLSHPGAITVHLESTNTQVHWLSIFRMILWPPRYNPPV